MYMKCSASESKAFLIDLDAELFIFLIQLLGPAHEKFGIWTGPKRPKTFYPKILNSSKLSFFPLTYPPLSHGDHIPSR